MRSRPSSRLGTLSIPGATPFTARSTPGPPNQIHDPVDAHVDDAAVRDAQHEVVRRLGRAAEETEPGRQTEDRHIEPRMLITRSTTGDAPGTGTVATIRWSSTTA